MADKKISELTEVNSLVVGDMVPMKRGTSNVKIDPSNFGGGSEVVFANTYHVALNGNDSTGTGSISKPYLTIEKAISVANGIAAFDNPISVEVAAGDYEMSANPTIYGYVALNLNEAVKVSTTDATRALFSLNLESQLIGGKLYAHSSQAIIYTEAIKTSLEHIIFKQGDIAVKAMNGANISVIACQVTSGVNSVIEASDSFVGINMLRSNALNNHIVANGNSTILIHNSYLKDGENGLYANEGTIYAYNITLDSVNYIISTNNGGTIKGSSISKIPNSEIYDIYQQHEDDKITLTNCSFNDEKLSVVNWDNVLIDFGSDKVGDEAYHFIKELVVGTAEKGRESVFGRGDSFTRGMRVYKYTEASMTYEEVTDNVKHKSDGNYLTLGKYTDDAIYVSHDLIDNSTGLPFSFQNIKLQVETAIVNGSGYVDIEYKTSSGWEYLTTMTRESTSNAESYADELLERTGSEHIRFNINMLDDEIMSDEMLSGTDRYWIRIVTKVTLTSAAVLDQIKIGTDRWENEADGFGNGHGLSRPIKTFLYDWGLMQSFLNSPSNSDMILSDTLGVGRIENRFNDTATDIQGYVGYLPEDLDTSCPMSLTITYAARSMSVSGTVEWLVHWGWTNDDEYNSVYIDAVGQPTIGPNEQIISYITPGPSAENEEETHTIDLDVSEMVASRKGKKRDRIWIALKRIAGTNPNDTCNGDICISTSTVDYYAWSIGGHKYVAPPVAPLSYTLLGAYNMNEIWNGTADEVIDSSSKAINMDTANGTLTGAGKIDNGGYFDGVNQYLTTPVSSSMNQSNAKKFGVSAWIYLESSTDYFQIVMEHQKFMLRKNNNDSAFQFALWIGGSYVYTTFQVPTMPIHTWMNVTASYDGDLASGNIRLWLNGTESVNTTDETGDMAVSSIEPRVIGWGTSYFNYYSEGRMDMVTIYDQTLVQDDATDIYNAGVGRELS